MRKVLLALALLGLAAGSASATPEILSNGVFIAHYAPSLVYTTDTPAGGWGEALQNSEDAIDECADQMNRLDGLSDHQMWFIVSAWDEDKIWCSTQMGIEGYDPGVYLFQDNGPVYPGGGTGLEIYTNSFPHGDPVGGPSGVICGPEGGGWGPVNFEPVWWFEGYAYGSDYGSTVVQLGVDPSTAFGGWFNCENPPGEFAAVEFGGMGVNTDGVPACPGVVEYLACCFPDGSCELLTEDACIAAGGMVPGWDYCEPNDCPPPPPEMVCCFENGDCAVVTEEVCGVAGGTWRPDLGDSCEPNNCPQPEAACCFQDGTCEIMTEAGCMDAGGDWYPDWVCEPNDCPVATDAPSWGSIKAMYR